MVPIYAAEPFSAMLESTTGFSAEELFPPGQFRTKGTQAWASFIEKIFPIWLMARDKEERPLPANIRYDMIHGYMHLIFFYEDDIVFFLKPLNIL